MDYVFRTLVDLKYDVEDLRREFERYMQRHPELTGAREASVVDVPRVAPEMPPLEVEEVDAAEVEPAGAPAAPEAEGAGEDAVYFRPGMTMEELERAAIMATLRAVGGNRRRASEKLGIGERTLYRKLKEYEIES